MHSDRISSFMSFLSFLADRTAAFNTIGYIGLILSSARLSDAVYSGAQGRSRGRKLYRRVSRKSTGTDITDSSRHQISTVIILRLCRFAYFV